MEPVGVVPDEATTPSILLHVVSPSAEAQRLTFPDTPVDTTVGQLKLQIQGAVASRPYPERQRLIYQGKPLLRSEVTLESIFGKDAIGTAESFTLHLVLPPTQPSTIPSSTSSTTSRQASPRPPSLEGLHADNTTHSIPTSTHDGNYRRESPANTQSSGIQPPPVTGTLFNQPNPQFDARSNPFAGQQASSHGVSATPHTHTHHHPHNNQAFVPSSGMAGLPQHVQQAIVNAQQQAALHMNARLQSVNNNLHNLPQNGQQNYAQEQGTQIPNRSQANSPASHTVVREGQIPGGQFRMVVNSTTIPIHRSLAGNNVPSPLGPRTSSPQSSSGSTPFSPSHQPSNIDPSQSSRDYIARMFSPVNNPGFQGASANTTLSNTNSPPTVYLLSSPTGYQGLLVSPSGTYASNGFSTPVNPGMGYYPSSGITPRIPRTIPRWSAPPSRNTSLPSSPAVAQDPNNINAQVQPAQTQAGDAARANQDVQDVQGGQAEAAQGNNDAADILRIMIPIGGHLWVAVRMIGLIWLLTHGSSWTRTILTGVIAVIFLLAQAGILTRPANAVANPVRRHLENLLRDDPQVAQERARREIELRDGPINTSNSQTNDTAATTVTTSGSDATPGAEGVRERGDWTDISGNRQTRRVRFTPNEPDPRVAAARLLRERREQDISWIRTHVRRAERAVFLFAASLVPGVGELHVAARRASEEQAREEAEREFRQRRDEITEEAERARREGENETRDTQGEESEGRGEEASGSVAPVQAEEQQQNQLHRGDSGRSTDVD